MLSVLAIILLAAATSIAQTRGQAEPPSETPAHLVYLPQNVVERMLTDAQVKSNDVVYDLGCGDARISILAAKKFGASAVCVDNNPRRIMEARDNAAKEGVSGRITFLQQPSADLSAATVVTMSSPQSMTWLGLNGLLNETLVEKLRPGARLISNFVPGSMKERKPSRVDHFTDTKGRPVAILYMWVIEKR